MISCTQWASLRGRARQKPQPAAAALLQIEKGTRRKRRETRTEMEVFSEEAAKYVWGGAIPLQIRLHESEVTTLPPPPPALVLKPSPFLTDLFPPIRRSLPWISSFSPFSMRLRSVSKYYKHVHRLKITALLFPCVSSIVGSCVVNPTFYMLLTLVLMNIC